MPIHTFKGFGAPHICFCVQWVLVRSLPLDPHHSPALSGSPAFHWVWEERGGEGGVCTTTLIPKRVIGIRRLIKHLNSSFISNSECKIKIHRGGGHTPPDVHQRQPCCTLTLQPLRPLALPEWGRPRCCLCQAPSSSSPLGKEAVGRIAAVEEHRPHQRWKEWGGTGAGLQAGEGMGGVAGCIGVRWGQVIINGNGNVA